MSTQLSAAPRRSYDRVALALVLVLAAIPLVSADGFSLRFGAEILLIGTAVMSLNLLIGGGGLVSLGHAAVFGAAGYCAAVAAGAIGAQLPAMLFVGIAAGMVIAGIMGAVTLRSTGLFFLVLTLVVGQMVWELAFRWRDVTGGADGLRGFPKLALGSLRLDTPLALYLLAAAIAVLGWAATRSFQQAPIGQALAGVRDQPIRMGALGYQVGRIRVMAFLVAGAVAGAAGSIYPFVNQYIGPNAVHWSMSAALIIMAVIGGVGSLYGGYLGALVYLFVQTHVSSYTDRWQLVIGLIFVATVILMPNGIAHWLGQRGRAAMNAVPKPVAAPVSPATLLQITEVAKSFGGARVLESVTLDVRVGETLGLIGPNGAGKTTLFNIVTGFLPADTGTVVFDGRELGAMAPAARARMGLVRTFQKSLVFPTQSIRRNVAMAMRAQQGSGYRWFGGRAAHARADEAAQALIDGCALAGRGDEIVADLSYGEQRIVDMLIALAQSPRILLLDEPTAGLSTEEAAQLLALVRQHHADTAVVLIAHDLDVVFRECDRIAVLDLGRLITVDTPDAVRRHPGVQAAYLGALAEGST